MKKSFLSVLTFGASIVVLMSVLASPIAAQSIHIVQPGENLSQIASRYDTSISELVAINGISNPNFIFVGQSIRLPGSQSVYYVKQGDTLSDIAVRLQTNISNLVQLNNISNPNLLQIGQAISYGNFGTGTLSSSAPTSFLYRVNTGDTLGSIATKFETSINQIGSLNEFDAADAIYAKDLIRIPSPQIVSTIYYWATEYGVPPDLLLALTWWESGWDNTLVSYAGAIGIGQLIPATVDFVSEALIGVRLNPYNSEQNIRMSARFMAYLLSQTNNNSNYALAAYYQGLGAVTRYGVYNSSWRYINGIQALRSQFR